MSVGNLPPCRRDCEKRKMGCHGSCEEYQEWSRKRNEDNERRYREKEDVRRKIRWMEAKEKKRLLGR